MINNIADCDSVDATRLREEELRKWMTLISDLRISYYARMRRASRKEGIFNAT